MKAFVSPRVARPGGVGPGCVLVEQGVIRDVLAELPPGFTGAVEDCSGGILMPGFVDSHVHVNEPGRTEWEGFATATQAAAAGGITTLVDMPLNCIPVTTSAAAFRTKLEAVKSQLWVDTGFWGGVTPESLPELPGLLASGVLGVKSFLIDSGIDEFRPIGRAELGPAMRALAASGLPYLFHAELEGPAPREDIRSYSDFVRSRPGAWEIEAVRLVIEEAARTGCRAHIVHLSEAGALADLRAARVRGTKVSAETCPHYLVLDEEHIAGDLGLFKCCPPIRSRANAEALWRGLLEGGIDCVVSDHSPCTGDLKARPLGEAWGGISSLQFGPALIWSHALERGIADPAPWLARWMCEAPARLAGLWARKGSIEPGKDADFALFDPSASREIQAQEILYRNKHTPYAGRKPQGRVTATYLRGEPVWSQGRISGSARGMALMNPRLS